MQKISFSITLPIILTGLFVLVMMLALNYQAPNFIVYGIFLLLAIYVFLFGVAIGQRFGLSIKKLLSQAKNLAKGDVESRLYLNVKNELGELASVLNTLGQQFEAKKEETRILEKSVDMKVKAKTDVLHETIFALEQKVKNRTIELQKVTADTAALQTRLNTKEAELQEMKNQLAALAPRKRKKVEVKETV